MRHDDGDEPAIGPMIGAMASPLIEQHEALMTQESIHLREANSTGRIPHSIDEFGPPAHNRSPSATRTPGPQRPSTPQAPEQSILRTDWPDVTHNHDAQAKENYRVECIFDRSPEPISCFAITSSAQSRGRHARCGAASML